MCSFAPCPGPDQLRLEDRSREASSLSRQLEQSLADGRRLEEEARDKALQRERNAQARILELEAHINRLKTDLHQTKRSKEDVRRPDLVPPPKSQSAHTES